MKLALCNLAIGDDFRSQVELGYKSLVKYCADNDYPLYYETELLDKDRHVYWNKLLMIKKYLSKCDVLVWVDSDIMFLKTNTKMEKFVDEFMQNKDFLMCRDNGLIINTGVWFCRNTPFVVKILDTLYEMHQYDGTHMPEQLAFTDLWEKNFEGLADKTTILPNYMQHLFNCSMYDVKPNTFLVHFLGIHNPSDMRMVMNAYYPYKKDDESQYDYYHRVRFLNNKHKGVNVPLMKIAVCCFTVGDDYKKKMELGERTREKYCKKRGYTYITDESVYDKTRHPAWSKLLIVLKYLKDFDYIWLLDSDTMIFKNSVKLEDYVIDHMYGRDILACMDVSGQINTGSMLIRNSEFSHNILKKTFDQTQFLGDDNHYWEQTAFNYLYKENVDGMKEKCNVLFANVENQKMLNCPIGFYNKDAFMVHFYGPRDSNWVQKCMSDLYPSRLDGESDWGYNGRKDWHRKTFGGDRDPQKDEA